ncbi:Uncharacterised protein [Klebsiella pneumoniae]|uniref:hypothetical protein n=1 Tax=Klebsiella pneumoniae TaxID=573 RepID=UPI0007CCEF5D|nr:Uncharacterised protein [Klebsiella pneumoniae]
MTKSTITRERIQRIIRAINSEAYDEEEIREWLSSDEIMELSRMALAAMDSEPVEMPLDYLQGHKDGLEWASQLAEANHPETGDWLYDDPIELAKAIRKGPDMPPVQPVADSEPDRNPVLAYADSYRDMAKQGVESVPIWSVITDIERNIAPLYRHAQPAQTGVDDDVRNIIGLLETNEWAEHCTETVLGSRLEAEITRLVGSAQPAPVVPENCVTAEHRRVIEMLLNVCGAAFELADDSCQQDVDGGDCHVVPDDSFQKLSDALDEIENTLPTEDIDRPSVFLAWSAMPRAALKSILQAGNPPVIPDGYVMVPMRLTAENGAKGALSGEFSETKFVNCPECFGDDECETCDGSGRIEITVPVTWTTIKEIWAKGVEHFSATPREVKGE